MSQPETIILYDSAEAATHKTVQQTGWYSSTGRFWGDDEHMARYDGSTHRRCDCGEVHTNQSYCTPCKDKREAAKFLELDRAAWDGTTMVYSQTAERYFHDKDDLAAFIEGQRQKDIVVTAASLQLVLCEGRLPSEIDLVEIWSDDMPEDGDESHIPSAILDALETLNKAIKDNATPLSYWPTEIAVSEASLAALGVH
jgi:hypothetical protein